MADFDHVAEAYDKEFTHTEIGKYQRDLVYQFLQEGINDLNGKNILEINAGTGEDAIWFANQGAKVTCTDISPNMVDVAKAKANTYNDLNISHEVLDITKLSASFSNPTFDVVFSNFGGLNCITKTQLNKFFTDAEKILNPNGKIILVVMPSFCVWETNYFLAKLNFKQAFRRLKKKGANAKVGNSIVKTYYFGPKKIKRIANHFTHEATHPVGFFIPPSYLESFFKNRKRWLNQLWKWEKKISNKSFLAPISDHYFISLKKI